MLDSIAGLPLCQFSPTSHHVSAKAIIARLNAKTDNKTDTKTTRCALPDSKMPDRAGMHA